MEGLFQERLIQEIRRNSFDRSIQRSRIEHLDRSGIFALKKLKAQGTADKFYTEKQLLPENFAEAAKKVSIPVQLRFQEGYDHSYFFISTFVSDHIAHHSQFLV